MMINLLPYICIVLIVSVFFIFMSWKGARIALSRNKKRITANEAKIISDMYDSKIRYLEDLIYNDIKMAAYSGNRYVQTFIDKDTDVPHETIINRLKKNGYKVSWSFSADHDSYTYEIWW